MKTVVFRADASLQIGTGHVMRCLTLANKLKEKAVDCVFICRAHQGNLIDYIGENGFATHALPAGKETTGTSHKDWLGETWENDAAQTIAHLQDIDVDWMIVDHYALDERWETQLRPYCTKLMAIDDLADRAHNCDLLLDQNLGRTSSDYKGLTPEACKLRIGPHYTLLRPEFAEARTYSLERRANPQLKHLLITMGGVDQNNATGAVLSALRSGALPDDFRITVVMGPHAPWLSDVQALAETMPWPTDVKVSVKNMAHLMANSDLAIGAAGSTSWERCCLGLPSLMMVLADNQMGVAKTLSELGVAILIHKETELFNVIQTLLADMAILSKMSRLSSEIIDGCGVGHIARELES